MDPAALIPTPDAIPVHWGWLQLLLQTTLFCHILLMNITVGTACIALVGYIRDRGAPSPCTELVVRAMPFTIAFTVNFGVAPLLFGQVLYGQFLYTSSILMAVFWLAIVGLLIVAYALAYFAKHLPAGSGSGRPAVAVLTALLLLATAFFFVNNFSLMQAPASWSRYFAHPRGLLLNLGDPTFIPRFLHFIVGAVAIGGLAIALWFRWRRSQGEDSADRWIGHGCRWFSFATLANAGIGLWFLASLPHGLIPPATSTGRLFLLCLAGGSVFALAALFFGLSNRAVPALACILVTLALMLGARSLLRATLLAPWFSLEQLPLAPATTPFMLFVLILAAGLALIAWMMRFTLRAMDGGGQQP
ncbi:hypothetical protein [Desulfobulbus sp.]|uniref:hypothetical protein n=1 Tax=Desulfobulbus sp. TaxID=895 RepID=UPI00286F5008|nr:hypothetical protein [Desulfobulbus sp.]